MARKRSNIVTHSVHLYMGGSHYERLTAKMMARTRSNTDTHSVHLNMGGSHYERLVRRIMARKRSSTGTLMAFANELPPTTMIP